MSFTFLLDTLGRLGRHQSDKDAIRDQLLGFLAHPRMPVKFAAIAALGELRDASALPALRGLASDDDGDRLGKAAMAAVKRIEEQAAFAPREVPEMREEIRKLQKQFKALQESIRTEQSKDRGKE
jgi:HEAT repeat protein